MTASDTGWAWWGVMLSVSVLNLLLLAVVHFRSRKKPADASQQPTQERRLLHAAAVVFTFVCAYRSVLPRIDVERVCWLDTPLNWIIFGRLAATFAEVAWAMQMGLVLRRLAICLFNQQCLSVHGKNLACAAGILVIAFACIAECWSWTNLITENNIFAVVEQGLWSAIFLATGMGMALLVPFWRDAPRSYRLFAILAILMGAEQAWEAFGLYLSRFQADQAAHKQYQGFSDGLKMLAGCATVTQDIQAWSGDFPWMTGYFSFGVWSSIWLSVAAMPQQVLLT